jgi:eukaryotic-like serine/threonine-protein kinase
VRGEHAGMGLLTLRHHGSILGQGHMSASLADDLASRARRRLGTVVDGKWRLETLLGVGGMAAVYAASHRNGKRAALKILHPEVSVDSRLKARFLREGYLANKLGHPGAVSVLDEDEADGLVFLVMELLEGETLDVRYQDVRMTERDVLGMAAELLDVLVAAHDKSIIHRDLKPANLFVSTDGALKVLDFGIARLRELAGAGSAPNATTVHSMGTPGFMAPEQARGLWEEVDGRSDLWAVGATMFNLLTGRYVHDERTVNETLLAAMTKPAPRLASVLPESAPALAAIVDRALAFDRADRFQSAAAMQESVKAAYQELTGQPLDLRPRMLVVPRASMPDSLEVTSAPTLPEASLADDEEAYAETQRHPASGGAHLTPARTTGGAVVPSSPPPAIGPRASRRRALTVALPLVVVLLVATGGALLLSGAGESPTVQASPEEPASREGPDEIAAIPAESPDPTTAPGNEVGGSEAVAEDASVPAEPEVASAAASSLQAGARPPVGRPSRPRAAPRPAPSTQAPAPSPSATVDLFGRRR